MTDDRAPAPPRTAPDWSGGGNWDGWREPPPWAQDFIVRPAAMLYRGSYDMGFDDAGARCYVTSSPGYGTGHGSFWRYYRWRLKDDRWLLGRCNTSALSKLRPSFAIADTEKPDPRPRHYAIDRFPAELLRR